MALNPRITDWRGKRVWLVGASSGIGAILARTLLQQGARVALSARRADALTQTADGFADSSLILALDVTVADQFGPALAEIVRRWGGIDLVVLNAGTYLSARAWKLDLTTARATFDTNVIGVMAGVACVVPQLLAQGSGGVAIVASVAGYRGLPRALIYGASKAALINFAESLYLDLHPRGIAVTLINPGFVATPLTAGNDFRMPGLITPERAAQYILAGFARGYFEIHFPRRFSGFLKLLRLLPIGIYLRLLGRVEEKS